jgi:hypothetical protein
MIYVYALCDAPPPLPDGRRGLEDRPLEAVEAAPVAAVYSCHDAPRVVPTPEAAWRHEGVVETLAAGRAVLPARFGTTFPDAERLRAVLARHADALAAGLDRVRGLVEVGVRLLGRPPAGEGAPAAETGRAYLQARLAEERRHREWAERAGRRAEEVHARLAAAAREGTRRVLVTPELLLSAAYLVPRGEVDAFRRRVEEVGRLDPEARVLCTGPWPAYHFVPQLPLAE